MSRQSFAGLLRYRAAVYRLYLNMLNTNSERKFSGEFSQAWHDVISRDCTLLQFKQWLCFWTISFRLYRSVIS
jgi:hypothetical protein